MFQSNDINSNKNKHNNINNQHTNLKNTIYNENITITLKLDKGDNYVYVTDNLQESSKIKIPLDGNLNSTHQKKEKNISKKPPIQNIITIPSIPEPEVLDTEEENHATIISSQIENIKKAPILIPSCSQWFDMDTIHEIEMNSLPEFFCGKYPSKTPQVYKEYRNFIISLYRENPQCYLSATGKNFLSFILNIFLTCLL